MPLNRGNYRTWLLLVVRPPDQPLARHQTAESRVLRCQALIQDNKLPQALSMLNTIIEQFPDCSRAYVERGNVLVAMSQPEQALLDYTAAIKYQPNYIQGE